MKHSRFEPMNRMTCEVFSLAPIGGEGWGEGAIRSALRFMGRENHLPPLEQNWIDGFRIFPWKSFRQTAVATRVIENSMMVIHVHPLLGGEGELSDVHLRFHFCGYFAMH
jgi:hypothetical protein